MNTVLLIDQYHRFYLFKLMFTPQTFDGIGNLTSLDLSYNKISDLPPGVFKALPKLQHLSLAFNPLTNMNGSVLWSSRNLVTLDLSGIGFKTLHKDFFSSNMT